MKSMIGEGLLPKDALLIANFCKLVNEYFCLTNNRSSKYALYNYENQLQKTKFKKVFKNPTSKTVIKVMRFAKIIT